MKAKAVQWSPTAMHCIFTILVKVLMPKVDLLVYKILWYYNFYNC